jgi:hypothetical protein
MPVSIEVQGAAENASIAKRSLFFFEQQLFKVSRGGIVLFPLRLGGPNVVSGQRGAVITFFGTRIWVR